METIDRMAGISPKLPLKRDPEDGYALTKTYKQVARQNLKMIVLTAPGERIMDPTFGVGLRNYLFRQNIPATWNEIEGKIKNQVKRYIPFITIRSITFDTGDQNPNLGINELRISVTFEILPLNQYDILDVSVS